MHAFTGLLTPDFTLHQHHKPPKTSAASPHVLSNLAQTGPTTKDSLLLGDKTTHLYKHYQCFATAAYSLPVCANIPGTDLSNFIIIKNMRHNQQVK